jgi:hypothetical protein
MTRFCTKCGAINDEMAQYCTNCQAQLAPVIGGYQPMQAVNPGPSRMRAAGEQRGCARNEHAE